MTTNATTTGAGTRTTRSTGGRRRPAAGRGDAGAALDLLERARAGLIEACRAPATSDRYVEAHLAALRAATALLAARAGRGEVRGVGDVWEAVDRLAPELGEWAAYFAVCGRRRVLLQRGGETADRREADDVLRAAETFLGLVQAALGLPHTPVGPVLAAAVRS